MGACVRVRAGWCMCVCVDGFHSYCMQSLNLAQWKCRSLTLVPTYEEFRRHCRGLVAAMVLVYIVCVQILSFYATR